MKGWHTILLLMAALVALPARGQYRADTILSVLRINDVVFASTRMGLFQSNTSQQKWSAVKLPKGAAAGGCLNVSDPGAMKLYYSPPVSALTERNDQCAIGLGLWMSEDLGKTWKNVDGTHYFRSVLARKDGVLYASGARADESSVIATLEVTGGIPLESIDGGKSWMIPPGTKEIPGVMYFSTCKKNAAHVCAGGWRVRYYKMEYAPEKAKWTFEPWLPAAEDSNDTTAEDYLSGGGMGSATSSCCYMQRATLGNYYALGFGEVLQRMGLTLETEKKRYEFSDSGAKVVDASVSLLPGVPGTSALALPDLADTEICWGLRYVDPDGGKHEAAPVIRRLNNPAPGRAHVVEVGKPYRREIDLQGVKESWKPGGGYRMVLVFENGKLEKKDEKEWTGTIVGTEVFEVEIK